MDWAGWALFGVIATSTLTALMITAQLAGLTRLDLPLVLGSLVTADPDRARVAGFFVHLTVGQGFAVGCAATFALLDRATWWLGGLLGLLHVGIAMTVLLPLLPGVHPRMASHRAGRPALPCWSRPVFSPSTTASRPLRSRSSPTLSTGLFSACSSRRADVRRSQLPHRAMRSGPGVVRVPNSRRRRYPHRGPRVRVACGTGTTATSGPGDASMGIGAFLGVGKPDEARGFLGWLLHASHPGERRQCTAKCLKVPLRVLLCHRPPSGAGRAEDTAGLADHLLGEAPFVVVPGHYLDERAVDDPGEVEVDDRGTRVADDVRGDQRILRNTEDALVTTSRLLPERAGPPRS